MKDFLNCPNCGSPVVDDHCEYCGSHFIDICNVTPGSLVFLKCQPNPREDKKFYVRAMVAALQFNTSPSYQETFTDFGGVQHVKAVSDITIDMELHGAPDRDGVIMFVKEEDNNVKNGNT